MPAPSPDLFSLPEWPLLVEKIHSYLYFDSNKEELFLGDKVLNADEAERAFDQIQFFQEYLIDEYAHAFTSLLQPLEPHIPIRYLAVRLGKEGFLGIKEQNKLMIAWEAALHLARASSRHALNPVTDLLPQTQSTSAIMRFQKDFRHLITKEGDIDYSRHPELSQLTQQLYDQEDRLRRSINEMSRSETWRDLLQYDGFDVMDERYVLPVRTDSYRVGLGLIVGRSDSGQTLFVEPFACREMAHKRLEILSRIKEITYQIETNFFKRLCDFAAEVAASIQALLEFDEALAKARFCLAMAFSRPKLRDRPGFAFHDLFHPLIKNPVKNDVYVDAAHVGLVISGPNTGGKTALLKAIAFAFQLHRHGLFAPALHAEIYPYDTLYFMANDLQDISAGLSSFSGEVVSYLGLSERLGQHNLVLVDEIFNSTASDEASALALALIDNFNLRKQTHFVLSTHHQLLKNLAGERQTILSGSMGFDVKEMKPNYRFYQGVPGQSMAVEIFERLSGDNPYGRLISQEARMLLDHKQVNYEKLVQQVATKGRELDELLIANRSKERELMNREKSLEGVMKLKLNDELARAREKIDQIAKDALEVVEQARSGEISKTKSVENKFGDFRSSLNKEFGELTEETPEEEVPGDTLAVHLLRAGNVYYNTVLRKEVQLQNIDWRKRQAVVAKGSLTVTVPLNTFKKGTTTVSSFQQIRINIQRETERPFQLDCRGMRLEEFQHMVEKSIGDLLSGEVPVLSVIHGHGDGVLKSWLRTRIGKSKDFKWDTPQNGNDGETEIRLKD